MRLTVLALALTLTVAANSSGASASEGNTFDRFQLWHYCDPTDLVVEDLHKDAADIGLTKEAITIAVRSRLRAARLYDADAVFSSGVVFSNLYVSVGVAGQAYTINVTYQKWLKDPVSDEEGFAATWNSGSVGTHGENSSHILSRISQHTDRFIDEYLRVNADTCG